MAVAATTLLLGAALGVLLVGHLGTSVGTALPGLRVVSVVDARPVGWRAALARTVVVELATLPTAGLGAAALALASLSPSPSRPSSFWRSSAAPNCCRCYCPSTGSSTRPFTTRTRCPICCARRPVFSPKQLSMP